MSDLTELGQLLHEEHFRILVAICGLENRVGSAYAQQPLDPNKGEDRRQLEDLQAALGDVIGHHSFEETVIFPLIRENGEADLARILTVEHAAIEPMALRLLAITDAILADGEAFERWTEFRNAAAALIAEMMSHLQKEELTIVQHLDALLDPETDHRIAVNHVADRRHGRTVRSGAMAEHGMAAG
jgi:Uncharacterized conserved protein